MRILRNFFRKIRYDSYFYPSQKKGIKYIVQSSFSSAPLLTQLMEKHGSDKGGYGREHNFSDFYSKLFFDRTKIKKLLEVGLGSNDINVPSNMGKDGVPLASLRAWKDYFLNATIYGADVDKKILKNEEKIKTYYVDQTDKNSINEMWKNIGEKDFDIIIDDGLHNFNANICLLENSLKYLSKTGIYIIEDIYRKQIKLYEDYLINKNINFEIIDIYNKKNMSNNCLILIRVTE
tara:strand:- start:146 stop:847 length:702 start_codon:yes stop_codon:yes gene_type:complete